VDGSKVRLDLPPHDIFGNPDIVVQNLLLDGPGECVSTLYQWRDMGQQGKGVGNNAMDSAETLFANEFLIGASANSPPPSQMPVDQSPFLNSGQFRIYQRFQAYYELQANGAISGPPFVLQAQAIAGTTPEPCTGLQLFSLPAENNTLNGQYPKLTSDGTLAYQVNEARLGPEGQGVNQFLNGPAGADYTTTTPWIWSVVQFDANGKTRAWTQGTTSDNLGIFPTYQVYTNGFALTSIPQSDLMTFIGKNSAFQYGGPL
jgi:hypothetical protein